MRSILLIFSALFSTLTLIAAPVCTTFTLATAPAECQIDDLTFDNFVYTPFIGAPASSSITVNPVSDSSGPGLAFSGPFSLNAANRFMIFTIEFDVTAATTGVLIDGSRLAVDPISAIGGVAGVAENVNGIPLNVTSFGGGAPVDVSLAPISSVHVVKNVVLVTGATPGVPHVVTVGTITQQFSPFLVIPEPANYLLLGCGLLVIPWLGKKLRRRS